MRAACMPVGTDLNAWAVCHLKGEEARKHVF